MKSTKKLLMATLMLVVAFVAATSATFAWFTMRQEAAVTNIQLQAATYGEDLQIALEDETELKWGYNVTLPALYGELSPVTFDKTEREFYTLEVDETTYKFKQVQTTENVYNGTSGAPVNGFLEFDLWFRTTNTEVDTLNFNVKSLFTTTEPNEAEVLDTLRVMFIPTATASGYAGFEDGETLVLENQTAANSGTYGTGDYFVKDNKFIAAEAFKYTAGNYPFQIAEPASEYGFLKETGGEFVLDDSDAYQLDDTFVYYSKYTTTLVPADGNVLKIANFSSNAALRVRVVIWIEGWDGDTTNNAALQNFVAGLKFSASKAA